MTLLPGKLPYYTTNIIHVRRNNCRNEQIGIYLFTLRDPLQRLMSWFAYERPYGPRKYVWWRVQKGKPLFIDCGFETMNQLGEAMSEGRNTKCGRIAWQAITGSHGYVTHNKMNYGYYWKKLPQEARENARIAVIRTEHLEQDWRSVERVSLRQPEVSAFGNSIISSAFERKNQSAKKKEDSYLSELALRNLCAGLCEEIQVYKKILRRAENLSPEDVSASLTELRQSCPLETSAGRCPNRYK